MRVIERVMGRAALYGGAMMAGAIVCSGGATASAQDIVLNAASGTRVGKWVVQSDSGAATGKVMRHPDAGAAKITTALASPSNYFELTFQAEAGKAYRLWLRGKAEDNYWGNDSVFVQFSGSVTSSGSGTQRIGTTSASEVNLEECSGCGLKGWKWQDNGWGVGILGPKIYFSSTGTQKMRVQTREDGLSIDQIILSPSTYMSEAPDASSAPTATVTDAVIKPSALSARAGKWTISNDSSAIDGVVVRHPDGGAAKITTAYSSPANYFEATFSAVAGVPYRIWLHGRAEDNGWDNDSVFVQFSGSVTSSGSAKYRIGTTSATEVNLEKCSGCGLSGWDWRDNSWGTTTGPLIYFATTGTQKIRVQTREDGLSIDRIILSPSTYLKSEPTISGPAPSAPAPAPEPDPDPAPSSSSGTIVKLLDWNIHHGVGTDGDYDLSRFVDWIVKAGANVVSLNEVEKYTGWGNEDQPARFASMLKSRTGKTWYYNFAQRYGGTNGQGNLLLSTFPLESSTDYELSYDRSVAHIAIVVNGIRLNIFSTHLDADYASRRTTQMKQLIAWAGSNFGEQRIMAGDFNAWPGATEIDVMEADYDDMWAVAQAHDLDVAYSGNTAGNTRNSRIDYIWRSERASRVFLQQMRVFDTRDSSGVMPSDHRPIMATFEVR
jgi:endonuclease/exonuclease/phosphatase family metal-dependent hydrolase